MKILTVDDSKAVRIIVKKAFKNYDVNIVEAANGQEGLEAAKAEKPDLILLDVTMPVMDGVEMLSKLKENGDLKNIPVIMLTAEAGKENVMRIAKIGVRDYIVKPFKEEVLVEKAKRVVEIKEGAKGTPAPKTIDDPCEILVVEDKPAIIEQIQKGIEARYSKWKVQGVNSMDAAENAIKTSAPHVVIVSLSLPDGQAMDLYRGLKAQSSTKEIPVFGLAVKTAQQEQQDAQQAGFKGIMLKPVDVGEVELKICRALKLDASGRYYKHDGQALVVKVPADATAAVLNEVGSYLGQKVSDAVDNGFSLAVFDIQEIKEVDMELVKFLVDSMKTCQDISLDYSFVSKPDMVSKFNNFAEAKDWSFCNSVEEAKSKTVGAA